MSKYLELADQCEKATGPDREIDLAIFTQITGKSWRYSTAWADNKDIVVEAHSEDEREYMEAAGEFADVRTVPKYTASIDAALTLAIKLRGLSLHRRSNPDMGGKDWLVSAGSNRSAARSWPLALCAVGLRERAKWADPNYFPSEAEVVGKLVQSRG